MSVEIKDETRKHRLERLLDLAQAYKGWTRKELAKALGRDPANLVPASGNPKLDYVVDLAEVLDWPIGDVAEVLFTHAEITTRSQSKGGQKDEFENFKDYHHALFEAQKLGEYSAILTLAVEAKQVAEEPDQRALAAHYEALGWDGLGRYHRSLEASQDGLNEPISDIDLRFALETALANAHYSLWHLAEARATSGEIITWYRQNPASTSTGKYAEAQAVYTRGHALRRIAGVSPCMTKLGISRSRADLERALRLWKELAVEYDDSCDGIGNICHAGIIELDVMDEKRIAEDALAEICRGLESVIEPNKMPIGNWLESYGWWCVFGCNIALRHLTKQRDVQHYMALFTNKADEIANRLGNWSLRERVFTMQFLGHQHFVGWAGRELPMTIDSDDIRLIAGTMGRFPTFRRTGWKILNTAHVIKDK
ncbi:MAG: hypothetical protein P8J86_06450 [Phycisphaerales bacterium]|nr:hypothetical protein [Phycisphaerales bacterium]